MSFHEGIKHIEPTKIQYLACFEYSTFRWVLLLLHQLKRISNQYLKVLFAVCDIVFLGDNNDKFEWNILVA